MTVVDFLRGLTVGRIAFWVVAAIPLLVLFRIWLDPGEGKDGRLADFVQGILALIVDAAVTLIGAGITAFKALKRESIFFWVVSTAIVASPVAYVFLKLFFDLITTAPLHPFDPTPR